MEHPFTAHHNKNRRTNNNNNNDNERSEGSIMSEGDYSASVQGSGRPHSNFSTISQPMHNFFRSLNPYNHRSRRHRSQQEQRQHQQQLLPLQQQQPQVHNSAPPPPPPPPPPTTTTTTAATTKLDVTLWQQFVQAALFIISLGSLCISLFLLYQYLTKEPEDVPIQKETFSPVAERLMGGPMIQGSQAWAHASIIYDKKSKTMLNLDKIKHVNISRKGYSLSVSHAGLYYIYFSVSGNQRNKNEPLAVEVFRVKGDDLSKPNVDDVILRSEHRSCLDGTAYTTTLSNGGLFNVDPDHRIFVRASTDDTVVNSFLGMFLVAPGN